MFYTLGQISIQIIYRIQISILYHDQMVVLDVVQEYDANPKDSDTFHGLVTEQIFVDVVLKPLNIIENHLFHKPNAHFLNACHRNICRSPTCQDIFVYNLLRYHIYCNHFE